MTSVFSSPFKIVVAGTAATLSAAPAYAGTMSVSVEIPKLRVAEYHSPYIAMWVEDSSGKAVKTLDVWYQLGGREDGRKWLPDLRGWWRKAGRSMKMPASGISGPTQAPGVHRVNFTDKSGPLAKLPAGSYKLQVEAAREVGGREMLTIPFTWGKSGTYSAQGSKELGAIKMSVKP